MRDSLRTLMLIAPLLLTGCDKLDLASVDLPSIDWPWHKAEAPPAPSTVALRDDTESAPDGMQTDDLRAPFGDTTTTVTAANGP